MLQAGMLYSYQSGGQFRISRSRHDKRVPYDECVAL